MAVLVLFLLLQQSLEISQSSRRQYTHFNLECQWKKPSKPDKHSCGFWATTEVSLHSYCLMRTWCLAWILFGEKKACMLHLFLDFTFLSMIAFLYLASQPTLIKQKTRNRNQVAKKLTALLVLHNKRQGNSKPSTVSVWVPPGWLSPGELLRWS